MLRTLFIRPSLVFIVILLCIGFVVTARESHFPFLKSQMATASKVKVTPTTTLSQQTINTVQTAGVTNDKLTRSWTYYKANFMTPDGQSLDPDRDYQTTSEGQSYLMLRAVIMDDPKTFTLVWNWTRQKIQHKDDYLFSWLYGEKDGRNQVIDTNNATDADEDIALALIMASYRFGNESYLSDAKLIIENLWEKNVVTIKNRYYLIAGAHFAKEDGYVVNPSYLSPASYRVFSVVDEKNPWMKLADDSYFVLHELATQPSNTTGLVPNWTLVSKTGTFSDPTDYIETNTDVYGYDAFRSYFRIALDAKWFATQNAKQIALLSEPFLKETWDNNHTYKAVYTLQGKPTVTYNSISTDTGALSVFMLTDEELRTEVYQQLFAERFNTKGYWGDGKNYYDQNWAWFATALYTDNFTLPEAN